MANNQLLFNWCHKFDQWRLKNEPEYFIHKKQIDTFFQNHTLAISFLNSSIEKLDQKYLQFMDGKLVLDNGQPVFKDATQKSEYMKDLNELMNRNVDLIAFGQRL